MFRSLLLLVSLVLILQGCATLPKEFSEIPVKKEINLSQVLSSPENYKGSQILWGGRIVSCFNKEDFTLLEIVQFPLDLEGKPQADTSSEGRFLVETPKFLDCAIYTPGKLITVAGVFKELRDGKIGEKSYKFPVLEGKAFHLWKEEFRVQVETYPHYFWCYPYWYPLWYYPCFCP
jgi:outer membrane lipoprotein